MNPIKLFCFLLLAIFFLLTIFSVSINANPIPVYPKPKITFETTPDVSTINYTWLSIIFILDFFIDVLIIYCALILLNKAKLITDNISDFSRKNLLLSVLIISLIGIASEFLFGSWIVGVLIALIFIFISYIFVSKYILKISWKNSLRISIFAVIVNIIFWSVIFSY